MSAELTYFHTDSRDHAVKKLNARTPLGALLRSKQPGSLLITDRSGSSRLDTRTGELAHLVDPEGGRLDVSYNDGKVDRWGCIWLGTSDLREVEPRGCLWCLSADGQCTLADTGFIVSNGPAFSPDGHRMYFSDTLQRRILVYEIRSDTLRPQSRRVFATFQADEGMPDGLTVDSRGYLWAAHWDGWRISQFAPDGERALVVPMPGTRE